MSSIHSLNLSKPISVTSLNSFENNHINVALEKNLETMTTQIHCATAKPSQLTQNDLQLFDSTSSTNHYSRDMTPDSINNDSINEEPIDDEQYYQHLIFPLASIDHCRPSLWPCTIHPFEHQHPELYFSYPTATTNGLLPFYPSYDPLLVEQHCSLQTPSAYYAKQQALTNHILHEYSSLSGT